MKSRLQIFLFDQKEKTLNNRKEDVTESVELYGYV